MTESQPSLRRLPRRDVLRAFVGGAALLTVGKATFATEDEPEKKLHPEVVAFDAIGTLFDIDPVGDRLRDAGLPKEKLDEWYARLGRDAGALDRSGVYKPFREVAAGTLEAMLADAGVKADAAKVEAFLGGLRRVAGVPGCGPRL